MGSVVSYFCDVCNKEKQETELAKQDIQCIFTTEQTEGRPVKPYLSKQQIEICDSCYSHVLKGNYLYGNGAMGYNNYYFKEDK